MKTAAMVGSALVALGVAAAPAQACRECYHRHGAYRRASYGYAPYPRCRPVYPVYPVYYEEVVYRRERCYPPPPVYRVSEVEHWRTERARAYHYSEAEEMERPAVPRVEETERPPVPTPVHVTQPQPKVSGKRTETPRPAPSRTRRPAH